MRALITGVAGFAGSFLAEFLLGHTDWQVDGCVLPHWDCSHVDARIHCREVDLRDPEGVRALLEQTAPDAIFHLAAQAFVPASWQDPWQTLENNIRGQSNLLNALVQLGTKPRFLVVGSNEEYGQVSAEDLPIRETCPLRPGNPYAVSKVAQDMLGYAYFVSHRLPVIRVRPFNHVGPRQASEYVVPSFARQIAAIEAGMQEPVLRVGNLSAARDFSDARDVVRGYYLAVTRGEPGEVYNLGSGTPVSVEQVLYMLLSFSAIRDIRIELDPARMRPSDTPIAYCDPAKFKAATGWEPEYSLEQTLQDVLQDWRVRVTTGAR